MKVKVGNTIYDSEKEPIMIILSDNDKANIEAMLPEATKYCAYPDSDEWTKDDHKAIRDWMDNE